MEKPSITISSSAPAVRPSRFRTSTGMTTRPALSMVVVMGVAYHASTIPKGQRGVSAAAMSAPKLVSLGCRRSLGGEAESSFRFSVRPWIMPGPGEPNRMPTLTKKVFLSSTFIDLKEYREAAIHACQRVGLLPVYMED